MNPNPFGRTFWIALGVIVAAEVLSAVVYVNSSVRMPVFAVLMVMVTIVAVLRWNTALLILFGELLVGSYGRLFTVTLHGYTLSLRYGLFVLLIAIWCIRLVVRKEKIPHLSSRVWQFIGILGVALLAGVINGILRGNASKSVFNDANAYAYVVVLLPVLTLCASAVQRNRLYQLITAAIVAIALRTLVLLAIFSHQYSFIRTAYRWVRDTRMEEVTQMGYNFVRIFSPTQLYSLVGFFVLFCVMFFAPSITKNQKRGIAVVCALALSSILVSMSRTFWLAFAVSLTVTFVLLLRYGWTVRKGIVLFGKSFLILCGTLVVISFVANYPYLLNRPGAPSTFSFFTDRTTAFDEAALYSRYDLLMPMAVAGMRRPFLGSGFGTTITFTSHDPRALTMNNGVRTTYAFEWGYLDFWLKLGLFGLIIIAAVLVALCRQLWATAKHDAERRGLLLGFFVAVIAVAVSHATSPYLNHPLGIGVLILAAGYLYATSNSTLPSTKR